MHRNQISWIVSISALLFGLATGVLPTSQSLLAQELPERPPTSDLLPETTVALFKLRDLNELYEKLQNSSSGQMLQSESVQPLVEGLKESAIKQYDNVRESVGLSLEEIQSLPSGEITIAIVAPRRKDMAFVVMMEVDPENEAVEKAIELGRSAFEDGQEPFEPEESKYQVEIEKKIIRGSTVYFCNHDGLFIGCSSKQVLDDLFVRWAGGEIKKVRPLAENRKFITISKRCSVADGMLPDVRFFVDPIGIFKSAARGDAGMQFAIALLPTLGLDGLSAIGGNLFIDRDDYESISHGHVLLASTKEGIFDAVALKSDTYEPEPWVPVEIAQYMTTSWDVPQMLAGIKDMSDKIVEGQFDNFFDRIAKRLESSGVEVRPEEILGEYLSGRITFVRPILSSTEINGIGNAISFGLNEVELFDDVLNILYSDNADEVPEKEIQEKTVGSTTYWVISQEYLERQRSNRKQRRQRRLQRKKKRAEQRGDVFVPENEVDFDLREQDWAFGIIGESFVISDSEEFFLKAEETFDGEGDPLADDESFLNHVEIGTKLIKTDLPAGVFYFDSVREIEFYLQMLDQDNFQNVFQVVADMDDSGFFADIKTSIDQHGFPEIEEIKNYLSNSGGFITSDDSGYHFLFYQQRPDRE